MLTHLGRSRTYYVFGYSTIRRTKTQVSIDNSNPG